MKTFEQPVITVSQFHMEDVMSVTDSSIDFGEGGEHETPIG